MNYEHPYGKKKHTGGHIKAQEEVFTNALASVTKMKPPIRGHHKDDD